ncbi:hypothetical protein VNO77_19512 [Canavalia gladiata]|uniref:Uncharacterized protein n=1 Tax=Canavalia gladiata TaxID=3824 RepID=A0AAN9LRF8_CANGL
MNRIENPSFSFIVAFNPTYNDPEISVGIDEGQYGSPFDSDEGPSIIGQRVQHYKSPLQHVILHPMDKQLLMQTINARHTNLLAVSASSEGPNPYEFELQLEEILSLMQLGKEQANFTQLMLTPNCSIVQPRHPATMQILNTLERKAYVQGWST